MGWNFGPLGVYLCIKNYTDKKILAEAHASTIVLMYTEVFMVIICQIHKLCLPTILHMLARVSGDDDYYHVINNKAEEAEITCAGKSMHFIVSHKKVAVLCEFCMYSFGECLQF